MKKYTRAIYVGDLRFNELGVFELNENTNRFELLTDKDISYGEDEVMCDLVYWKVFEFTDGEYDEEFDTTDYEFVEII